jgi:hypothetical protein
MNFVADQIEAAEEFLSVVLPLGETDELQEYFRIFHDNDQTIPG